MKKRIIVLFFLMIHSVLLVSSSNASKKSSDHDIFDQSSIRLGAKIFLSTCMSCHDLSYLRYSRMEKDLNWPIEKIEQAGGKIGDIFLLGDKNKKHRTDLSLLERVKGANFIYNYINSNIIHAQNNKIHHGLLNQTTNRYSEKKITRDLTNFLAYAAEPIRAKRMQYGYYVITFLLFFLVLALLLKKEYWKNLKL